MVSPRFPIHVWVIAFIGMFFPTTLTSAAPDLTGMEPNPIEKIEVQIFGHISNADALQIRRLLRPYVEPENVKFRDFIDVHGRKSHHTTLVEITPKRERYVHTYRIIRQLNDHRFRGIGSTSKNYVVKSNATVSGVMFAHAGWSRSYIRNVPFWRNWRGETSAINHALVTPGLFEQKFVFSDSNQFDLLRMEAGKGDHLIRIRGDITGFDGPYPILSVRKFVIDYIRQPLFKNQINLEKLEKDEAKSSDEHNGLPKDKDEN